MGFWCWTRNLILQAQPWPITLSSEAQICPWRYGQIISKSNINSFILKCPVIFNYYLNIWDVQTDVWKFFQSCSLGCSRGQYLYDPSGRHKATRVGDRAARCFCLWTWQAGFDQHHQVFHVCSPLWKGQEPFPSQSWSLFVFLCRKILRRTGVFYCFLVTFKAASVPVSPRWAESLHSKMVLCFFFWTYSECPL